MYQPNMRANSRARRAPPRSVLDRDGIFLHRIVVADLFLRCKKLVCVEAFLFSVFNAFLACQRENCETTLAFGRAPAQVGLLCVIAANVGRRQLRNASRTVSLMQTAATAAAIVSLRKPPERCYERAKIQRSGVQ